MEDKKLLVDLARRVQQKYFGKYKGLVEDNKDPKKLGRLKLKVPSVLGEAITEWALPCLPFGGSADQGLFMIPEAKSQVWVEFAEGELSQPIWVGVFWSETKNPPAEAQLEIPTRRILKTPAGHALSFEDKKDEEQIMLYHSKNTSLSINAKGDFVLTVSDKSTLTFEAENKIIQIEDKANENKIVLKKDGITIKAKSRIEIDAPSVVIKTNDFQVG